jgi:hypothetical protein
MCHEDSNPKRWQYALRPPRLRSIGRHSRLSYRCAAASVAASISATRRLISSADCAA